MPWPFDYTGGYDPDKSAFYLWSQRIVALAATAIVIWLVIR